MAHRCEQAVDLRDLRFRLQRLRDGNSFLLEFRQQAHRIGAQQRGCPSPGIRTLLLKRLPGMRALLMRFTITVLRAGLVTSSLRLDAGASLKQALLGKAPSLARWGFRGYKQLDRLGVCNLILAFVWLPAIE